MINNKQFFDIVKFQVSSGSAYPNPVYASAYMVNSNKRDEFNASCIFNLDTGAVYEIYVHDCVKYNSYRWVAEEFRDSAANMSSASIEVEEDILEKLTAIVNGVEYDTRITMPIEMSDEDFLVMAKAAHAEDITFNEFIEKALTEAIKKFELERKA